MVRDTGFPAHDAENDFTRQRRRADLSKLITWMRRQPGDVNLVLPFDEVVAALGKIDEKRLGPQVITLESIVGSVDRTRDFDRYFRPTSARTRERWQRLATAQRRGESMPPIDVYRVGNMHFVIDGHHRVSIAYAMHLKTIEAYVTEIRTRIPADGINQRADLLLKDHRRGFLSRVPLSAAAQDTIEVTDPWDYAVLAETVEAWGFRLSQELGSYLDRRTLAHRWFGEEFLPVVRMARTAEIGPQYTDAELYLWVVGERYRLIRRHTWDDDVLTALKQRSRRSR